MDDGAIDWRAAARAEAYAIPLEHVDPVDSELFRKILIRFPKIEVVGEPVRVAASFANGYSQLPVCIPT